MVILNVIFRWVILGSFLFPGICFSQLKSFSFEEIENLQKSEKRNIVIFIHTDWCNYCKAMENTTFKNKNVIEKLNQNFYFVKLNAEEKRNITFAGKDFHFKPTGRNIGIHELAEQLGKINGEISYPALVILNHDNEIIFQYNEYVSGDNMGRILSELNENK